VRPSVPAATLRRGASASGVAPRPYRTRLSIARSPCSGASEREPEERPLAYQRRARSRDRRAICSRVRSACSARERNPDGFVSAQPIVDVSVDPQRDRCVFVTENARDRDRVKPRPDQPRRRACRRSWNVTSAGSPARSRAGSNPRRDTFRCPNGVPSRLAKIGFSSREKSLRSRSSFSSLQRSAGIAIGRTPAFVFVGELPHGRQLTGDVQEASVPIEVTPAQPEHLALT